MAQWQGSAGRQKPKRKRAGLSLSFKHTAKTVQNNASLQMSMGFQAL